MDTKVTAGQVIYPTHSEAAYPALLCDRISSLVKCEMLRQGAFESDDLQQHVRSDGKSLNRIVLGALPRGKHVKPLV